MASTKGQLEEKTPVIIVVANRLTKDAFRIIFEKNVDMYGDYSITLVGEDDVHEQTFACLFDYISDLIKTMKHPPLIVATCDRGAIVHAALARVFPHIIAPSLESECICIHKGDSYKNSPEEYLLPYFEVQPGSKVYPEELTNAKIGQFPLFVKPSMGTNSSLTKKAKNLEELNDFIKCNEKGIKRLDGGLHDFLSRFLDDSELNNCARNSWIVQPYVDNTSSKLLCLDGLITGGKITIWNLSEYVFWENHPSVIKCNASPVQITSTARKKLLEAYHFVAEGLIQKGFNNQFFDLEAFVSDDGKVRIAEINGRVIRAYYRCYIPLYGPKGDNLLSILHMASGMSPEAPVERPGVWTIMGYICINEKGIASDFVDFEVARNIEEIELKVEENTVISPSSEWGHQMARCYTSGNSFNEALEKCRRIVDRIVIAKDKCLWLA